MSNLQVTIRAARAADVQSIWCVHVAAIRGIAEHYSPEHIAEWAAQHSPNSYTETIRAGRLFVAEAQGEIIGFGQFDAESGEIERVYVTPGASKRGVGRRLMQEAERRAWVAGVARVHLSASFNAVRFYERCGYKVAARGMGAMALLNQADTQIMAKALHQ